MLGANGLVGGAEDPGCGAETRKAADVGSGGAKKRVRFSLGFDAVGSFSALGLEGFDVVPGLLHRAGHEASDRVLLPAHFGHGIDQQVHLRRRVSRYVSA
jgi:hypothetical protein